MTHQTQDLLNRLVAAIDRRQRRRLGIREFSDDPRCILRLGTTTAHVDVELADGTAIRPGDVVGVIHLWNERMPQIPPNGPDLAWAREFKRSLAYSFRLLARHIGQNPALADVHAFGGGLSLVYTPATIHLLRRLGFEVFDPIPPRGMAGRVIDLGARAWTWLLRRAFNPASVRGLRLSDLQRRPVWFSRRTIITLYGPGGSATDRS
jgi:hypothetical protein